VTGAYDDLEWATSHVFANDWSDEHDRAKTAKIPPETMEQIVYGNGSQPEEEIDMDDVIIVEDSDGIPTYINPNEEPTKPMPWASTPPRYAKSTWDDITVVERIQIINTEA
jgi:hypothetical protein